MQIEVTFYQEGENMKRQKELNEKTLDKARKEKERVLFLQEKIRKAQKELYSIEKSNRWMHSLGEDFWKNSTEEQEFEFYEILKVIS